jgi:hypothetical protein
MDNNWDFKGWVVHYGVMYEDGRIINKHCFDHQDGQIVPMCYNNEHKSIESVLGNILLEAREEGVYCYGYFKKEGTLKEILNVDMAKNLVREGDLKDLSLFANNVKSQGKFVTYANIREVSLCLRSASPRTQSEVIQI